MRDRADHADAGSIVRYLGGVLIALWALFMALQPDPGFVAPWPWIALFWVLQIGLGLFVLQSLLFAMSRVDRRGRIPLWLLVLASGVIGACVLAPMYWLIGEGLMQQALGFTASLDDDADRDPPLAFGLRALAQEFGEIVGPVTAAWALISWPRLRGLLPPIVVAPRDADAPPGAPAQAPAQQPAQTRAVWRAALPSELGNDVIAVASELQYLRVWTTRGSTLVLGSLQDVEDSEGTAGIRVHRSWWVHASHVRSVRRRGEGAVCELSDGREVPVSRRRKSDVLARFGDGARYDVGPAPAAVAPRDQDQNMRRRPNWTDKGL